MDRILFGVIGYNIAETTRMIEIAKTLMKRYDCHFFSYGGEFEYLIEEAGFPLHKLEPRETPEKTDYIWKIVRGETFKQPWTAEEVALRVESEVRLLNELKPKAAFFGSVLTFSISCRLTNTLLFNFIPLALSRPYLRANLPFNPFYPRLVNRVGSWAVLNLPLLLKNIQEVMTELGLPKPKTLLELWEGDVNIVAETEELSLLKSLPDNWYFSGPLYARLEMAIPDSVKTILEQSKKPLIYFAMGSSANRKHLLKVMYAFEDLDVDVIAPIRSHLHPTDRIPGNVCVTDWLPALEVTKMVDVAVIHGGQGTVQTTVSAGIPFVGIGMQSEQDLNIFLYREFGNAIQLDKRKLNAYILKASITKMISTKHYHLKAKEAQVILNKSNTHEAISQIVEKHLIHR